MPEFLANLTVFSQKLYFWSKNRNLGKQVHVECKLRSFLDWRLRGNDYFEKELKEQASIENLPAFLTLSSLKTTQTLWYFPSITYGDASKIHANLLKNFTFTLYVVIKSRITERLTGEKPFSESIRSTVRTTSIIGVKRSKKYRNMREK